ncbi:MAG TPA: hypothetical protein VFB54_03490 [Burkholderiales bacterium]|nr:hypothetical protein [Burkholderiales bacterium]
MGNLTPEQQAAYDKGVADAKAEIAAEHAKAAAKKEHKPHHELDYTGPLTGDQAAERHARFGDLAFRHEETKPAAAAAQVKATK